MLIASNFDPLAVHVAQPYAVGDTLYASSTSAISKLTIGTTNQILKTVGGIPAWGVLDLAASPTSITGILPVANGGTGLGGATPYTVNGVLYASAANVIASSANLTFNGTNLGVTGLTTATGGVKIIDGANLEKTVSDLTITCAAQKTVVLSPTVWKDVSFPMGVPKATGAGNPTLLNWIGNLSNYTFAVNDVHNLDPQEFPHDGLQGGTGCSVHVHWISRTNVAATRGVKWEVEYSQTNVNGVFPATTTISAEETVAANTTAFTHYLTPIGTFTAGNIDGQMCMRLKRITAAGTAPADDPIVLGVHYHYQSDTMGSRQIATK